VNVLGVVLQSFVVSRIVKYAGLGAAFFVLPVIALSNSLILLVVPVLAVLRIGKTVENAADYSFNNTVRQMLWLPTTKAMKYKAKQAVDTFFVRIGDVASALLVYGGAGLLSWSVRGFAAVNAVLVGVWLVLAVAIVRENRKLLKEAPQETAKAT
jgi:AAA family ATP:ADP antiporter